jgi:hypothetical protein
VTDRQISDEVREEKVELLQKCIRLMDKLGVPYSWRLKIFGCSPGTYTKYATWEGWMPSLSATDLRTILRCLRKGGTCPAMGRCRKGDITVPSPEAWPAKAKKEKKKMKKEKQQELPMDEPEPRTSRISRRVAADQIDPAVRAFVERLDNFVLIDEVLRRMEKANEDH